MTRSPLLQQLPQLRCLLRKHIWTRSSARPGHVNHHDSFSSWGSPQDKVLQPDVSVRKTALMDLIQSLFSSSRDSGRCFCNAKKIFPPSSFGQKPACPENQLAMTLTHRCLTRKVPQGSRPRTGRRSSQCIHWPELQG